MPIFSTRTLRLDSEGLCRQKQHREANKEKQEKRRHMIPQSFLFFFLLWFVLFSCRPFFGDVKYHGMLLRSLFHKFLAWRPRELALFPSTGVHTVLIRT